MNRYLIATFVNDGELYAAMRASFEAAGFVEPVARYVVETGDPYEAITRLGSSETPYVILVHQDVFADQGHDIGRLDAALDELTALDPFWAVAGNAGGAESGEVVRHLSDKWGADWRSDLPKHVSTLDENLLVFRTSRRPRCTPGLSGFHLYGADVCLNAAADGSTCYVIDFRVSHAGKGDTRGFDEAAARLGEAWGRRSRRPRIVHTSMGPLPVARWAWQRRTVRQGAFAAVARLLRTFANDVDRRDSPGQSSGARLLRGLANAIEVRGAMSRLDAAPEVLPEAYDFIAAFQYGVVQPTPTQSRAEMLPLLERLAADPPRTVVELGTHRGGALFLLSRAARPDAVLVSVDSAGARHGDPPYPRSWARFFRAFARDEQAIHLIRSPHPDDGAASIRQLVGGEREVDALVIDGVGDPDQLQAKLDRYRGLVRKGGVIAVHGIVSDDASDPGPPGPRIWRELRSGASDVEEFVDPLHPGAHGIGVVRVVD